MNSVDRFERFLNVLGYPQKLLANNLKENTFTYPIEVRDPAVMSFATNRLDLKYVYTPTEELIFETHSDYWNQNSVNVFVAVSDYKCHIINAREKPEERDPLSRNINIKTFDYGVNSEGFEKDKLKEISKESVDSTYFFDFIIEKQKTTHEVDKDLLLNLIALRNDLVKGRNERIVYLLILRCLFIKYLEDRGIYRKNYLLDILRSSLPENLLKAFNEIRKINGDIFKQDRIDVQEIKPGYLEKLSIFFSCDYRSRQGKLFPYRFDKIPVQLISSVYEAFLKSEDKKDKGIYYTPSFIVDFMLSHTLKEKLKHNPRAVVLDPACGSGAFLVESFKMIVDALPLKPGFEKKKEILENQLFGIDSDPSALQIAAFSLYLVLLETEDPEFIRHQIEYAHPILPGLIGKTLVRGNALVDDEIFRGKKFDCIIANPPWGSIPGDEDVENIEERKAIGAKGKEGTKPEYKNVSDYERSQAFLLRVGRWGGKETIFSLVVKNSIFLNENADAFRKELLQKYRLTYFYEMSDLDKILFKKRPIGKINGKKIEIGATEPCAIVVFDKSETRDNIINYVSPKLTGFSEKFQLIHFSQKDVTRVKQEDFFDDDLLWRVLVSGNIDYYKLIRGISAKRAALNIICSRGFEPDKNRLLTKKAAWYRTLIRSQDFDRYYKRNDLGRFNWHQKHRRNGNEDLFSGKRILLAYRPTSRDNMRLRGIFVEDEIIFRDDVVGLKIEGVNNYLPYLAILNSSCIGFYLFNISSHWQGGLKRESLRLGDIKILPIPDVKYSDKSVLKITRLVEQIGLNLDENKKIERLEKEIDELVFDLYGLLEFEKEIIREFYQINVERKKDHVKSEDIQNYVDRFRHNFKFVLDQDFRLNAEYSVSPHMGAVVCFRIVKKEDFIKETPLIEIPLLNIVKKKQLQQSFTSRMLNEDRVKIYYDNKFYIVKSNYFKDWTERQAVKDANEEIGLLLKNLPESNNIG
ncbi:MAG: N-6 DNA methylase [Candidatus Aminicenantes bacterium]|nr:N-6 DNA methylase [Candidatus Aminicenantes bacterium]NIM79076.1 N-6 DNA methylase [Candidatus Aminicenantes bacterium]NIN18355.1 N-6 DNA methylase [Candidatus Aminicenantes bacterium]NIN42242.1 N-6 DNA methylase [Candidatus Aminicenantes bacterium]NIN85008.1 N-6 DNA methylase [Candidatus Aminicenantes bacterium]